MCRPVKSVHHTRAAYIIDINLSVPGVSALFCMFAASGYDYLQRERCSCTIACTFLPTVRLFVVLYLIQVKTNRKIIIQNNKSASFE